jgi:hypothetical protein
VLLTFHHILEPRELCFPVGSLVFRFFGCSTHHQTLPLSDQVDDGIGVGLRGVYSLFERLR